MPSASTELFLRMEAAAAREPEEATLGIPDSSQPSVCAQPASEHHAAPSVHCRIPALQSQAPVLHIQQQQQQQQQPEEEDDIYAGLERGTDISTRLTPSWHEAVATTTFPQQPQGLPAHAVSGSQALSQQGPSSAAPEQGYSARCPEHGPWRHQDKAGTQHDTDMAGKVTPRAAEAPLVKQGSYAVAAKVARLRNKRRQQEIHELNATRRQMAVDGKQHAVQVHILPS